MKYSIAALTFLLLFFSDLCFSQTKAEKRTPIKYSLPVENNQTNNQIKSILSQNKAHSKTVVYHNNEFHDVDYLRKLDFEKENYSMDIIAIPDSISKDLKRLIIIKNAVK